MRIVSFIIIEIIILLFIFLLFYLLREFYLLPVIMKRNCKIFNELRILLPQVIDVLEENNIIYWISSGTLLGHIRHNKKFIPHDDDVDLFILEDENQDMDKKFEEIEKQLSSNLRIEKTFYGYKFFSTSSNYFIDIFIYKRNTNKIICKTKDCRDIWPMEYYYEDELFPLKRDVFENINVYVPNNPLPYLYRFYGPKCLEEVKLSHYHDVANHFETVILFSVQSIPINIKKYENICSKNT